MAAPHALRKKNELYKNRALKHTVATKAAEKSKVVSKPNYSYWALGVLAFALFGGVLLQLIDLIF